jgi:hypothetical protein
MKTKNYVKKKCPFIFLPTYLLELCIEMRQIFLKFDEILAIKILKKNLVLVFILFYFLAIYIAKGVGGFEKKGKIKRLRS